MHDSSPESPSSSVKTVARNEPCPCGSGKKYKRCHGVEAAPRLNLPAAGAGGMNDESGAGAGAGAGASAFGGFGAMGGMGGMPGMGGAPGGMDFSKFDPAMMMQLTQALQRLPKGQMQRLQSLMQKAMAGKDVTREAKEFERTLPPDFKALMGSFMASPGMDEMLKSSGMGDMNMEEMAQLAASAQSGEGDVESEDAAASAASMSEDQARKIVEDALREGRISADQAASLLGALPGSAAQPASGQEEAVASQEAAPDAEAEAQAGSGEGGPAGEPAADSDEGTGRFSKLWRSIKGK